VQVVDEHDNGRAGVVSADAYMVQAAGSAEGEFAVTVDDVFADPVVAWCVGAWGGFGSALVGRVRGCPVEGSVRALMVVVSAEPVELGL
jgi:hypothetical protein